MKRKPFAFVEALVCEIKLQIEDFLTQGPPMLDLVVSSGFILGFLFFGTKVLKEGLNNHHEFMEGEKFGENVIEGVVAIEKQQGKKYWNTIFENHLWQQWTMIRGVVERKLGESSVKWSVNLLLKLGESESIKFN